MKDKGSWWWWIWQNRYKSDKNMRYTRPLWWHSTTESVYFVANQQRKGFLLVHCQHKWCCIGCVELCVRFCVRDSLVSYQWYGQQKWFLIRIMTDETTITLFFHYSGDQKLWDINVVTLSIFFWFWIDYLNSIRFVLLKNIFKLIQIRKMIELRVTS